MRVVRIALLRTEVVMKYITPMSFFPFYTPENRTFPSSNISRMSGEVRAPQNKQNLSETFNFRDAFAKKYYTHARQMAAR